MMISPPPVVFITLLFLPRMAQANDQNSHQGEIFVSAHVGGSITLQCFLSGKFTMIYWYKQRLGQKPQLISVLLVGKTEGSFYDEFQNNSRFTLDTGNDKNHLKITGLSSSDSAFYYCIAFSTYDGKPLSLLFLSVKDSFSFHQFLSTDQSGNSVTPNCTVDIGSCGEEHSVYWFRDSGESHPGLIYTQGGSNDQCQRNNSTQTHTCVYNLPVENLNLSRTGTYYCAVAACGHILFGERNKLDIENEKVSLVYFLSGALTCTSMLVIFQSVLLCRNRRQSKDSPSDHTSSSVETPQVNQEADDIHYAALSVSLPNRTRRQRNNIKNECLYASVKQN